MRGINFPAFFIIGILISLFCAIWSSSKPIDLLPDMWVYLEYYNDIISGRNVIVEPTYSLISKAADGFGFGFAFVIFTYAALSLIIKFYVIRNMPGRYKFVVMYAVSYLILHELIQIRIGMAMSMLFLGFYYYFYNKRKLSFVCFLCAPLFHLSTLVVLITFVISIIIEKNKFFNVVPYMLVISMLLAFSGLFSLEMIGFFLPSIPFLQYKLAVYTEMQGVLNEQVKFYSVRLILFYVVLFLFWQKKNSISYRDRIILLNVSMIFIIAFITSALPSFSLRLFEMAGPLLLILMARMNYVCGNLIASFIQSLFVISSVYYSYVLF
ncbi:MAG: EpsG family protein [Aeromonas sp.]